MNKLEDLVASLNSHEQKAFRLFLISPFFTTNKSLLSAFEGVIKSLKPNDSSLNQSNARLNRNKKVKQSDRYLQSELTGHLENFLALRHFTKTPYLKDVVMLQSLSEKDCEKSWRYARSSFNKKSLIKNAEYHFALFAVNENTVSYLSTKQDRKKKLDFTSVNDHLDAYYYSKKLQLYCEIINQKKLLAGDKELPFFEELKEQASVHLQIPAVKIYFLILHTLTDPGNEEHFIQARSAISQYANLFPAKELNELYLYIKNYCVRKINQGDNKYLSILFEIFKEILANKKLMKLDYLSQFEFKNIVSLSLRLNEPAWCDLFIKKYINQLDPDEQQNAFTYNSAYFYFMTGNYKNAIRLLQEVIFTDVVYQLDSKVILLKCYYEMDDVETLLYHASAFRLFLLRNRYISEYQKTINRNLIRYVTFMVRNQNSPTKIKQLKEGLKIEKNVADIKWLLNKSELL